MNGYSMVYLATILAAWLAGQDAWALDNASDYTVLGNKAYQHGEFAQARQYYEQALTSAKAIDNRLEKGKSLIGLGNVSEALGDHTQAREYYGQSLAIAKALGDRALEDMTLNSLGNVSAVLGDYKKARKYYGQSLTIAKMLNDQEGEGRILGNLGHISEGLGDYAKALEYYGQSLAIAKTLGDQVMEGPNLSGLGNVYQTIGDYAKALEYYEYSLAIARVLGDQVAEGLSLSGLGNISLALGDYVQARQYYEKSLAIDKALGDREGEAKNINNLGIVFEDTGDFMKAQEYYGQALALKKALGNRVEEGGSLGNLGVVSDAVGDYSKALEYYEQSLAIFREQGDRKGEGFNLNNLGNTSKALGEFTKAQEYYGQALAIFKVLGNRAEERISLGNLGDIDLEQGQLREALANYSQFNEPVRLGFYNMRLGKFNQAREQFQKFLDKDESSRSFHNVLAEYIGLGLSYEGLQNWKQSLSYFKKAVNLIEIQRAKLNPAARRQFLGGRIYIFKRLEAYEGLARVSLANGNATDGLYWAEHTKARLFLEALARKQIGNGLSLPEALASQENEINTHLASLYKQQDAAFNTKNTELEKSLEPKLAEAKHEQEAFVARLRREQPAYAAVAYPQPLHLEEIKLKPNEVLLEYEVTDSATLAWLAKDGKIVKTLVIPVTREALTKQVRDYRKFFHVTKEDIKDGQAMLIKLAEFDPKPGQALYDRLFKDFRPLIQDTDRLVLVPDDILAELPFEALVTETPDKTQWQNGPHGGWPQAVRYLGDSLTLRYAQSATALVQTRQFRRAAAATGKPLLVVADPVFNLSDDRLKPASKTAQLAEAGSAQTAIRGWLAERGGIDDLIRLEKTGESAKHLAELFGGAEQVDILTGFEANEEAVKQRLERSYRYGVFATHGILANDAPYIQEPALVLSLVAPGGTYLASEGRGSPGFLTLAEVMSLKIDSDLLALTACNTGWGGKGGNLLGEGVMSMGRGFQYAGVESVLMSLWSVEDNSTNLLTEKFFAYLKQGKNKLEALRLARADLRHEGYEHPYFWAPFILVGEL